MEEFKEQQLKRTQSGRGSRSGHSPGIAAEADAVGEQFGPTICLPETLPHKIVGVPDLRRRGEGGETTEAYLRL